MDPAQPSCRDAVLMLPGIMGSELVDTGSGDLLWGLSAPAYARLWISTRAIERLHVSDEERGGRIGRVRATRLLRFTAATPGLGGFEPYTSLMGRLRELVAHPDALAGFPYDWRLSVPTNAAFLAVAAERHLTRWRRHPRGSRDASLVLVAHSMGGLIAGYFTERLGGRDAVRHTVTLGTPFYGSVKAAHLLSTGRGAPLPRRRLMRMARTMPGLYDLLPAYRCVDDGGPDGRRLTPGDVASIGGDRELAEASLRLHEAYADPDPARLSTVVGVEQPTMQSLRIDNGVAVPQWHLPSADGPIDHRGDGTVYAEAARGGVQPIGSLPQSHGGLARTAEARAVVTARLTQQRPTPPMAAGGMGLAVDDLVAAGRPCEIGIDAGPHAMPDCTVVDLATGAEVGVVPGPRRNGRLTVVTHLPRPGTYRVEVHGGGYSPVSAIVLAVPADQLESPGEGR